MRTLRALIIAAGVAAPLAVSAADYPANCHGPGGQRHASNFCATPAYVPYVPPLYYLPSPPQYVRDLRAGGPGRWVQRQPSFFDRLFGAFQDGY